MDTANEWQRNDVNLRIHNSKLASKTVMQGTKSIITGVFGAISCALIGLNGAKASVQVKVEQFWYDSAQQSIEVEPIVPEQMRFVNSEVRANDDVSD